MIFTSVYDFQLILYGFMLIHIRFDVFVCVFVVFMWLVCPISVPAALRRPQKKHAPGFWEQVSCVIC